MKLFVSIRSHFLIFVIKPIAHSIIIRFHINQLIIYLEKTQFKDAPQTLQKLTSIIGDPNRNSFFLSDSTPILCYLDENYRQNQKSLFPNEKDLIIKYCLKLPRSMNPMSDPIGSGRIRPSDEIR